MIARCQVEESQRCPDSEKFGYLSAGEIPTKMSFSTKTGNIKKRQKLKKIE